MVHILCLISVLLYMFLYLAFGLLMITNIGDRHMKFNMDIDHKCSYKLFVNYCFQANHEKYGDGVKL